MKDLFSPRYPFKFPDHKKNGDKLPVVIQFSGGRTSGMMLKRIMENNDDFNERSIVLFQNTGREMEETLQFVKEVGNRWGVNIIWLEYRNRPNGENKFDIVDFYTASRNGEPFDQIIARKKYLPNMAKRFCSGEMKVETAHRYLKSIGIRKRIAAVGFRADEPKRVNKLPMKHILSREIRWCPLADAGITKEDVGKFWKQQGFDLSLQSIKGKTPLGNCDGCFWKSEEARIHLAKFYPERAEWWARHEAQKCDTFALTPKKIPRPWKDDIALAKSMTVEEVEKLTGLDAFCNTPHGSCETY